MLSKIIATLFLLLMLCGACIADSDNPSATIATDGKLEAIQQLIDSNKEDIAELKTAIKEADEAQLPDLELELEQLKDELKALRLSFEQVAIGSVDKSVLIDIDTRFDWREEVTLILQPIMENLKALTDKPRKINHLNSKIEHKLSQQVTIDEALESIDKARTDIQSPNAKQSLVRLQKTWENLRESNATELDLAREQLLSLESTDVTWWDTLRVSAQEFFEGRGLTLLIAAWVAMVVWLVMRAILKVFQWCTKSDNQLAYRTRRRLVQYAYRAFVFILMWISAIAVFYIRGDLLLLGLSIIATATLAIGLRQAVPKFIAEAQLLLNVGGIREHERVSYNGLPWQVEAINMFSVLRNPELAGVLRLPLRELSDLTSRPATQEVWFPSSKGDFVLIDDSRLLEVTRQTPEIVELRDAGGSPLIAKSADYYHWNIKNLSRGKTFGVSGIFGIDYAVQAVSLTDVPQILKKDLENALAKTDFAQGVQNVMVEFSSAGASSLDYLIYITLDSNYAKGYIKIKRLIQQTCVASCTVQGWNIPFPHISVQQLANPTQVVAEK